MRIYVCLCEYPPHKYLRGPEESDRFLSWTTGGCEPSDNLGTGN